MHASVNYLQVQPGKMDEFVSIYRDSIVPAGKQTHGWRGTLLLTDRNTGTGMALTLRETEADAIQIGTGGWYQEQVAKIAAVLAESTVPEVYEVSVQEPMLGAGAPKYARTGTGQIQPGKMAEMISMMRDTNFPRYRQQQGFTGGFLLTNASTAKGIHISLWETEADVRTSDARLEEQRQRIQEGRPSPPVVGYYEVSFYSL